MKKMAVACVMLCMLFSRDSSAAENIRIGGSGGMIPLVTELARAFMAENRDVVIEVNQKSLQSAGGIMGVAGGRLEIGMANRPFKDDEKGLGLHSAEIARVGVVVGVNRSEKIRNISSDSLCGIYQGRITDWKDLGGAPGHIIALTKSEKDATKETIRKSIGCFRDLREADTVVLVPTSPETTKVLSNRPHAIGFVDMVAVDESKGAIVALEMDGVEPTADHVRSGRYRIVQTYRLVTRGNPAGHVRDFLDFVKGPKGRKIIESNKAVPVK